MWLGWHASGAYPGGSGVAVGALVAVAGAGVAVQMIGVCVAGMGVAVQMIGVCVGAVVAVGDGVGVSVAAVCASAGSALAANDAYRKGAPNAPRIMAATIPSSARRKRMRITMYLQSRHGSRYGVVPDFSKVVV